MTYVIVVSKFNSMITQEMLASALKAFSEHKIEAIVYEVSGAVEIPLACQKAIQKHNPKAVIALGCVIKGETEHYDMVNRMCSDGIMRVMLDTGVPILFEVLMTDTYQKAEERIEKGYHAVMEALKLDSNLFD